MFKLFHRLSALTTGFLLLLIAVPTLTAQPTEPTVRDVFGRTLNGHEIVLVDWEGQIANPAIQITVVPPANAAFPATADLSANGALLYFDELNGGSTISASGPSKALIFNNSTPQTVLISVFPDRNITDETYTLTVQFEDANGTSSLNIPIRCIDQDRNDRPLDFTIHVDFSKDESNFFDGPDERAIVLQAAEDWAYFIGDMNLDEVPSGQQQTFIWDYPDAFHGQNGGAFVANSSAYTGFLLYTYGITCTMPDPCPTTATIRSGGEPADGISQSSNGVALSPKLWRSGGVEIETQGNYNLNGWFLTSGDQDWIDATNYDVNDLYSIAHHEIGHSISFDGRYPAFKTNNTIKSPRLLAYHGAAVPTDGSAHFNGVVDRMSKYGIFGNEYNGNTVPNRRWLITKLDLLLLEAVGYTLRPTSAFSLPAIQTLAVAGGEVNQAYAATLTAAGGIPFYNWTISAGSLPNGLSLDAFTGAITGTPTVGGSYTFTVRVCDYDRVGPITTPCASKIFTTTIESSALDAVPTRNLFTTATPTLTWSLVSWARGYELEVDDAPDFTSLVYETDTIDATTAAWTLPALPNNRYYWRVRAKQSNTTWGSWSRSEEFKIDTP